MKQTFSQLINFFSHVIDETNLHPNTKHANKINNLLTKDMSMHFSKKFPHPTNGFCIKTV